MLAGFQYFLVALGLPEPTGRTSAARCRSRSSGQRVQSLGGLGVSETFVGSSYARLTDPILSYL